MAKVKLLSSLAGERRSYSAGSVYDFTDDEANRLIDRGLACEVEGAPDGVVRADPAELEALKAKLAKVEQELEYARANPVQETAAKVRRGRPPGTKNKPKPPVSEAEQE